MLSVQKVEKLHQKSPIKIIPIVLVYIYRINIIAIICITFKFLVLCRIKKSLSIFSIVSIVIKETERRFDALFWYDVRVMALDFWNRLYNCEAHSQSLFNCCSRSYKVNFFFFTIDCFIHFYILIFITVILSHCPLWITQSYCFLHFETFIWVTLHRF